MIEEAEHVPTATGTALASNGTTSTSAISQHTANIAPTRVSVIFDAYISTLIRHSTRSMANMAMAAQICVYIQITRISSPAKCMSMTNVIVAACSAHVAVPNDHDPLATYSNDTNISMHVSSRLSIRMCATSR
jgi:hypothetical protein